MKNLTIPKLFEAPSAESFKRASRELQFGRFLLSSQIELQESFTKELQRASKIVLKPSKNRSSNEVLRSCILSAQGM